MAAISEGEVAVYDRQLRLWGVQAQQRLLKSKVLVWGLEGVNVEACKNLVLAGVSLTVRDHRPVGAADVAFNYFLREEDTGKNRAECAARRLQEMNPLCTVSASTGGIEAEAEKLSATLRDFDVVCTSLCAFAWDVEALSAVDAACREKGAGFMLSVGAGEMCFFFSDLQEHTVQERSSAQGGGAASGGAEENAAALEPETVSFPAFSAWLECAPAELMKAKVDGSIVLFALFFAFLRKTSGEAAGARDACKFEEYCTKTANCTPSVDGVNALKDAYETLSYEPMMHVASVVGGLLAQEVIKAITKRDPPLVNSVCFNAHTSAAFVERIPQQRASPAPKRKLEEAFDLDD